MDVLNSVSYDQYKNIPSSDDLRQKVKIVFSSECYENIMQMSMRAMNNNSESGSFFVGRIISTEPKVIYFDYYTSEFAPVTGHMGEGSAVIPKDENYSEVSKKIKEYKMKGIEQPVVLHFHSHPRIDNAIYESFSDQDLQSYAKMQVENSNCFALGMLAFPIRDFNTIGMCVVRPDNSKVVNGIGTADFVRYENIYYTSGNNIFKVGNFEKNYSVKTHEKNLNRGIVKQYLDLSDNPEYKAKVCAEGIDPNTGKKIEPSCVGLIDFNGHLCFPYEDLTIIPDMQETNIIESRKR